MFDNPSDPTEATVHVTLTYSDGSAPRDVQVIFAKFGRTSHVVFTAAGRGQLPANGVHPLGHLLKIF